MSESLESRLRELVRQCASLCREYGWMNTAGAPDYQVLRSNPSTMRERADLMLLAIHPRGASSRASGKTLDSDVGHEGAALLAEAWSSTTPGEKQLQDLALQIAGTFGDEPERLLSDTPFGYMIPFRTESISRLPDGLRKRGLAIGAQLVAMVRPRVLVLLGGDRVLFRLAVSLLTGPTLDSTEEAFGTTQRTYRDVVIGDDDGSTFAAVVPLHASEEGLRVLRRRLQEHRLLVDRKQASGQIGFGHASPD